MLPSLMHARSWSDAGIDVTLIDPHPHLYYSGMVPEYLGGVYDASEIRVDLARRTQEAGGTYVQDRAVAIDPSARTITTAAGGPRPFDVLAVDIGSANPSVPGPAIPTKPIARIRPLVSEIETTLASPSARLRLVVVGGGAAGVEVALNISGRFQGAGRQRDLDLTIVEQSDRLLPTFPHGLGTHVAERLRARGATIQTGTSVTAVEEAEDNKIAVHTDRTAPLSAGATLWATGTVGPSLLQNSSLPTSEQGFLRVTRSLRTPSHPRIFAAGDCASVDGLDLARVGVHAVKQGSVLRANLDRTLRALAAGQGVPSGDHLKAFRSYPVTPLILSTGATDGLWTAGPLWAAHPWLLRLKHWIDRRWIRPYAPEAWARTTWRDHLGAESAATAGAGRVASTPSGGQQA